MLLRPRSKRVAISIRTPPGELILSAFFSSGEELYLSRPIEAGREVYRELRIKEKEGWRTLYEVVAETAFERYLLLSRVDFERTMEGKQVRYTWRMGSNRGVKDREVDRSDTEAQR